MMAVTTVPGKGSATAVAVLHMFDLIPARRERNNRRVAFVCFAGTSLGGSTELSSSSLSSAASFFLKNRCIASLFYCIYCLLFTYVLLVLLASRLGELFLLSLSPSFDLLFTFGLLDTFMAGRIWDNRMYRVRSALPVTLFQD